MPLVRYSATVVDAIQASTRAAVIVKNGLASIKDNKAELAACVHTIEDYAFQQAFGDFVVGGDQILTPTDEQEAELFASLEDFCLEVGDIEGYPAPMRGDSVGRVNWKEFIRTYLPMIIEVLLKVTE